MTIVVGNQLSIIGRRSSVSLLIATTGMSLKRVRQYGR
eukprot:COSAG02_NODE_36842_length_449_cov_6.628571_1_plen_37_part_01